MLEMENKNIFIMEDDFRDCNNNIHQLVDKYLIGKFKNSIIEIISNSYCQEDTSCICNFNFESKTCLVKVNFVELTFNIESIEATCNDLVNDAYFLIDETHEGLDKQNRDQITALLVRKMNYFDYLDKKHIIDFCNDIFLDILTEHKLINGNKRMAYAVLQALLSRFGFYLKYTQISKKGNLKKNSEANIKKIKDMLKEYEKDQSSSRLETLKLKTKKFIEDNIIISCLIH